MGKTNITTFAPKHQLLGQIAEFPLSESANKGSSFQSFQHMKKTRRLLITVCVLMAAFQVFATDYKYLNIQKQDGDESSFLLNGLKLSFSGGVLTASQNGAKTTYEVADLAKMYFSETQTAIQSVEKSHTAVSLQGSSLLIKAPAGTLSRVFDASGKLVMSTTISSDGTPSSVELLQPGIYLVKAGNQTLKILVK